MDEAGPEPLLVDLGPTLVERQRIRDHFVDQKKKEPKK
jgi:hypothetical protein